ncbi:MAG: decarboxylase, partial [Peptococcaceae bacterium]|nr:decarboxylase [Peptococcaceae bacterium]
GLLPLQKARGKICASAVSAFPPCIPVLLPGEIITSESIAYINELKRNHATITGMTDNMVSVVF